MEHLLTGGNFFACNLSRNFATSWKVWRNHEKKKQINLFKPKRNATDPIIY